MAGIVLGLWNKIVKRSKGSLLKELRLRVEDGRLKREGTYVYIYG